MKFSFILVPISGISADEQAIQVACEFARRDRAKILAVHVIEVERALPLDSEQDAQIQQSEQILAHAQKIAKGTGYVVETDLLQSRVAGPAVVDEALERGVDLIVVGVPFRKHLGVFHLGSTTTYIMRNAACAVWMVREPMAGEKPGVKK